MMMLSSVLSDKVEAYLGDRNYVQLQEELLNPANLPHVNNEGMDLITKLCESGLTFAEDLDSIEACTRCLNHVIHNYKPKESLICLLEQGEAFVNSEKFTYLLPPLQFVMMNLPKKREKTFSWVLSTLKSHIKYYRQVPEELKKSFCDEKKAETLLFEQNSSIKSILQVYRDYIDFYSPFVRELESDLDLAVTSNDTEAVQSVKAQKKFLRDYLVDLLGVPLIHFDLEWNEEAEKDEKVVAIANPTEEMRKIGPRIKTDGRIVAEKLMELLQIVDDCPLSYFQWIENRMQAVEESKQNKAEKEAKEKSANFMDVDMNGDDDEDEEEIIVHMSSIVTYFYLILDQRIPVHRLTKAYSPTYMFNMILYPVTTVLKNPENILALKKAIRLALKILSFCDTSTCSTEDFSYSHRLHFNLLVKDVHKLFIERITYLAIYCQNETIRKEAYTLFIQYLMAFDPQGKYNLIQYIFNSIPSDSLIGHMIMHMKQFIYIATTPSCPDFEKGMEQCFLGTSGMRLISSVCLLKNGVTTDLCQHSNQIIASLNLLRFLLLRDKNEKKIGILDEFARIEKIMLEPLRKALDLSRAHYELKLKELNDPHLRQENENQEKRVFEEMKCDVKIGDEDVKPGDLGSIDDQKTALVSSVNTFDHMNGLLAWVYEAHSTCKC